MACAYFGIILEKKIDVFVKKNKASTAFKSWR